MIVMEELGRGLVLEPYLSTVILAGGVIRHAGSAEQKQARIAPIAAGDLLMALAYQEPDGPPYGLCANTCALRKERGWVLKGRQVDVLHGAQADALLVQHGSE